MPRHAGRRHDDQRQGAGDRRRGVAAGEGVGRIEVSLCTRNGRFKMTLAQQVGEDDRHAAAMATPMPSRGRRRARPNATRTSRTTANESAVMRSQDRDVVDPGPQMLLVRADQCRVVEPVAERGVHAEQVDDNRERARDRPAARIERPTATAGVGR